MAHTHSSTYQHPNQLHNEKSEELPLASVNFMRECIAVVKVICEIMVAIKIANSPE
jgi:hypothetical protein